jgi:hypothetical protein
LDCREARCTADGTGGADTRFPRSCGEVSVNSEAYKD